MEGFLWVDSRHRLGCAAWLAASHWVGAQTDVTERRAALSTTGVGAGESAASAIGGAHRPRPRGALLRVSVRVSTGGSSPGGCWRRHARHRWAGVLVAHAAQVAL